MSKADKLYNEIYKILSKTWDSVNTLEKIARLRDIANGELSNAEDKAAGIHPIILTYDAEWVRPDYETQVKVKRTNRGSKRKASRKARK